MSLPTSAASLPYHEPGIVTILIISSFLLLLNAIEYILDRIVYCGLIGQLFVGIAFGVPGAAWLSAELQHSIVQLGYIGLILVVYEGGLSCNLKALRANLFLSTAVALTGLVTPIGLSFVLLGLSIVNPLQAFAAGAALCSTSLGTTFTVLATSGLTESRLGVVLTSAAMMDDVVGLIMVQVISTLGTDSSLSAITVIRPVFVSIAFAILLPLICHFMARPLLQGTCNYLERPQNQRYKAIYRSSKSALACQTAILLAMVTGATYAGTSNLFAAYLAGVTVTWLCGCEVTQKSETPTSREPSKLPDQSAAIRQAQNNAQQPIRQKLTNEFATRKAEGGADSQTDDCSGKEVFKRYYKPVMEIILRPLFFASIGFAIPITKMFTGRVIWRGLVYTILMVFAKLLCGLWLTRFASLPGERAFSKVLQLKRLTLRKLRRSSPRTFDKTGKTQTESACPSIRMTEGAEEPQSSYVQVITSTGGNGATTEHAPNLQSAKRVTCKSATPTRPKSFYPAAILGSAMVARGEIGFLVSSIAESNGVFGEDESAEEFLVVTWAILLCTLIGPIVVGLLVKRVKRLQKAERKKDTGQADPLGIWGILPSDSGLVRPEENSISRIP